MSKKGIGWRVLSKRLVPRLPGVASFRGGFVKPREAVIDAYFRARPTPPKQTLELTIAKQKITVKVRTHALAPVPAGFELVAAAPYASFTGVHPGAAIAIKLGNGKREYGALCALLADDRDAAEPTHFMTCGHIFLPGSPAGTPVHGGNSATTVIGKLVTNLLDKASNKRDAALVELTPQGRGFAVVAGQPGPKLDGVLDAALIYNRNCRTWQPTTQDESQPTRTGTTTTDAYVNAPLWGGIDVVGVIATSANVSDYGDSGTVLASTQELVIGSCTGSDPDKSLFEPLGRVLDEISQNLTVWRNP
jgi:hypothetical protein